MSFGINPFFLIKPCFLNDQKVKPSFFLAKRARKFVQENVKGRGHQGKHWIEQFFGWF